MITIYTILQKQLKLLCLIIMIILSSVIFHSCGLFDKELKQDKHIARFRYQLSRVQDSIDSHKNRALAYSTIISNINTDKALISDRKKNILLVEGYVYISNEYLDAKNFEKALRYADTVVNISPASPLGYYSKGCIYQITEEDSLALINYNKAIKLNAGYTDAYYNRGIVHEHLEEYDKALADYNRALKLNPSYIADIYINRGNVYLAKEVFDKAIEDYTRVIDMDTTNIKAYLNRAETYTQQKTFDKALKDYDKAITLDSVNISSYINRASVFELMKEYNKAIGDYEKITELDYLNKLGINSIAISAIERLQSLATKNKKNG